MACGFVVGLPIACAAFVLAAGCVSDSAHDGGNTIAFNPCQALVVSPVAALTAVQTAGVNSGLALWNQSAHSRLSLGQVGGEAGIDESVVPLRFQRAAALSHGVYGPGTRAIFINDDLADHELAITLAHEVGHAFGLIHVPAGDRPSLMNAGNLDIEPTAKDVDALAALWPRCAE